jgi:hypothetical protein
MPPSTADRIRLGKALDDKEATKPNAGDRSEDRRQLDIESEQDAELIASPELAAQDPPMADRAQREQARQNQMQPRAPPALAVEPLPTTEQEAAAPSSETVPRVASVASAPPVAAEDQDSAKAAEPPREIQVKAGANTDALARADEQVTANAKPAVEPAAGPKAKAKESAPSPRERQQRAPKRVGQAQAARARGEDAAPVARDQRKPDTEHGTAAAGELLPAALAFARANGPPAGAALETRTAVTSAPSDLSQDVRHSVNDFLTAVAAQKSAVVYQIRASQTDVTASGESAKTYVSNSVGVLQNRLELAFGKRDANVAARRQKAEGTISASVNARSSRVEEDRAGGAARLDQGFAASSQQVAAAGTANAAAIRQNGEEQAVQAHAQAEVAGGQAISNAAGEAQRYGGEAADSTRERGDDFAGAMREQGDMVAGAARDHARSMADDLENATSSAASQITAGYPLADLAVTSLASAAFSGLGQLLASALPATGRLYDDVAGQLADAKESLFAELDNLRARFEGLVDQAVGNASGALDAAGDERLTAIETTESRVLDQAAEASLDPDGKLAAALGQVANNIADVVGESNGDLDAGANRMARNLTEGVTSVSDGASGMAAQGEFAADELETQADRGFGDVESATDHQGDDFIDHFRKSISDAVDCVERFLAPVVADVLDAIATAVGWAARQIESVVGRTGEEQRKGTGSFAYDLQDQYWHYVREGGLVGALVATGIVIVALLEYVAGVIWGIIKAVFMLIVGLIALIVGIMAIVFLFGFMLAALFDAVNRCVGLIPAIVVTLVALAVGAVVLILALVIGIIIGVIVMIVSILQSVWRIVTDSSLTPFERGELVGQTIADIVLLFLPFLKGRIRIGLPAALAEWLTELGETGRLIASILRLLGEDAPLFFRLYRAVGGDLVLLEELLGEIRSGSLLLELLTTKNMTIMLLRDLLRIFGGDATELGTFLRLAGRDATLLRTLLGLAGDDTGALLALLATCGDDARVLRRIFTLCGDDLAVVRNLLRQTGNDGALLLELLEAVNGNTGRLATLLGLADNPRQLASFLRGIAEADQPELERLLTLLRDFRMPLADVEFLMRTRRMTSLEALRLIESLMTERGRVTPGTASEARSILQAFREGVIADLPRRPGAADVGAGDVDFAIGGGRGGPPPTFIDIKTPVIPRFRALGLQAADIAQGVVDRLVAADTRVIADLANLNQVEKTQFLGLLRNEIAARGQNMDALIRAARLVIQNGPPVI